MNEMTAMIKTLDLQIAALEKAKAAISAALVLQTGAKPAKVVPIRRATGSMHDVVMEILRHSRKPLTARQLADQAIASGWKTASKNPVGLMGVELRKWRQRGEVKQSRGGKPKRFRLGVVIERAPKKEPWEKKLAAASELAAFDRGVRIAQREQRRSRRAA